MALKLYMDRMSQPSRAILTFCKVNGIEFEEVKILLAKLQHRSPEYTEINPMKQVPTIVHGEFKLFERYPADLQKRAKIHSVLDWHHSNLRRGSAVMPLLDHFTFQFSLIQYSYIYLKYTTIAPVFGQPLDADKAAEGEKVLIKSLETIESFWLQGDGPFLLGNSQPSIADLSLVCEVMQLEVVNTKDHDRILGPRKRILEWVEDTKNATAPHFEEIHSILYPSKERLHQLLKAMAAKKESESTA